MNKNLKEMTDEELFSYVSNNPENLSEQELEEGYAELKERGYNFLDSDDDLIAKLNSENVSESDADFIAAREELQSRGYDISREEKGYKVEKIDSKNSAVPLITGICLKLFSLFMAHSIYEYEVTGRNSGTFAGLVTGNSVGYTIVIVVVVIAMLTYYNDKQKGKYLWAWIIAGLIFGAWTLIVMGVVELTYNYNSNGNDKQEDINILARD